MCFVLWRRVVWDHTHTSNMATKKWLNFLAHLECNKKMKSKQTHTQQRSTKASIVVLELECVSDYVRGWVEFAFYMETKDGLWLSESRGRDVEKASVPQALSQALLSNVHHVDLIATTAWTSWSALQCLLLLPKLFHRCSWISSRYMERTCLFCLNNELQLKVSYEITKNEDSPQAFG